MKTPSSRIPMPVKRAKIASLIVFGRKIFARKEAHDTTKTGLSTTQNEFNTTKDKQKLAFYDVLFP